MERITLVIILSIGLSTIIISQSNDSLLKEDSLFSESFLKILNDMGNDFKNVRGELSEISIDGEKRYEASVYLHGMRNYTNESDILITEDRSFYRADYGPFFNSTDLENKKTELTNRMENLLDGSWNAKEIKNGMRFRSDHSPHHSVSIYHYYGDGSGIFVRIFFEVKYEG